MTVSPDLVLAHDPRAVARNIAGETVIVPVRQDVADLGSIYTLNATGTFVWSHVDGVRTAAELVALVVAEFEVSAEVARDDVQALLADLLREGLVQAKTTG